MFNQNELNEMTRRYQDWNAQFKQPFYMFQNDKLGLIQRLLTALRGAINQTVAKPIDRKAQSLKTAVLNH